MIQCARIEPGGLSMNPEQKRLVEIVVTKLIMKDTNEPSAADQALILKASQCLQKPDGGISGLLPEILVNAIAREGFFAIP